MRTSVSLPLCCNLTRLRNNQFMRTIDAAVATCSVWFPSLMTSDKMNGTGGGSAENRWRQSISVDLTYWRNWNREQQKALADRRHYTRGWVECIHMSSGDAQVSKLGGLVGLLLGVFNENLYFA